MKTRLRRRRKKKRLKIRKRRRRKTVIRLARRRLCKPLTATELGVLQTRWRKRRAAAEKALLPKIAAAAEEVLLSKKAA